MRFRWMFAPACAIQIVLLSALIGCTQREEPNSSSQDQQVAAKELEILEVNEKARKNLNLVVKAARPTDYWRTLTIPGTIADQPGISDRGVTSPAVGVVSEIHAFPGDTVNPGQRLVTLRLFSEYLQSTQTQLFKASQEVRLVQDQLDRLSSAANSGAVSGARLIELQNALQRQQILIQAAKQELLHRGLNPEQIAAVSEGSFVTSVEVVAPPPRTPEPLLNDALKPEPQVINDSSGVDTAYEVHSLGVELGQTVQAGDLIAHLANHQTLYIVGHAFKREAGWLERAIQDNVTLRVEFAEDSTESWPELDQQFQIRHLSNTIDSATRTFDFFVPLQNQSRSYEKNGGTFLVWRFRPGQRTQIEVPVERLSNVFVLPSEAVIREGANAYVYRQNGDLFHQQAVHILHEDRRNMVLANDGSIAPGTYLAQNAAASLRRVLKAQSANGEQPGVHVHADGTVHAAH